MITLYLVLPKSVDFFEKPTDRTDVIINTRTNEKWALMFRFSESFDYDGKVRRLETNDGMCILHKSYKKASGREHAFCVRLKICSNPETKMCVVLGRGECWVGKRREIYLKHSFSGLSSFNSNVKTESNDEMMIAVDRMMCRITFYSKWTIYCPFLISWESPNLWQKCGLNF